ncbi:unnamed protein product, partial [Rotaria magnacalcarata]
IDLDLTLKKVTNDERSHSDTDNLWQKTLLCHQQYQMNRKQMVEYKCSVDWVEGQNVLKLQEIDQAKNER